MKRCDYEQNKQNKFFHRISPSSVYFNRRRRLLRASRTDKLPGVRGGSHRCCHRTDPLVEISDPVNRNHGDGFYLDEAVRMDQPVHLNQ